MYVKPTAESYYIFKKVFEDFDTHQLCDYDRRNFAGLLKDADERDESSKNSKNWADFFVKEHEECNKWKLM